MRDEYIHHICKDRIEILLGKIETSTVQEVTTELNEILFKSSNKSEKKK